MASAGGQIAFDPVKQLQRPALLLANGTVYLAFGSHADSPPFHGWVLGYDARTLAQTCVFNLTPNGDEGAIWAGRDGHGGRTKAALCMRWPATARLMPAAAARTTATAF